MYEELLGKAAGKNTLETLRQMEALEERFRFTAFSDADLLRLGNLLVETAAGYGGRLALTIVRESDGVAAFQYVTESCTAANLHYAALKRGAVLATGHNSLWALTAQSVGVAVPAVFADPETGGNALPVGGAWPVMVNGVAVATLALSGLKNGDDFRLLVAALAQYFGTTAPAFDGFIV